MTIPVYPEGRPGYGEVKPKIVTRANGTTYQVYEGCFKFDGQRKYVSDADKKKAQKKLRDEQNAVEANLKAKDGNITLGEVIEEYLYDYVKRAGRGEVRKGSVRRERGALDRISDKLRRMKLADFRDGGLIEAELKALRPQYAIGSVELTKGALSNVFTYAAKSPQNYIPRNVMAGLSLKLGKPPKRDNMATEEEAALLLAVASQRQTGNGDEHSGDDILTHANFYAILWFILQTGARPEEACGLLVQDIKRHDPPPPDRPNIWMETVVKNTVTHDDGFVAGHTKTGKHRPAQLGINALDAFNRVERYWQAVRLADGHCVSRTGCIYASPGVSTERAATVSRVRSLYLALEDKPLEVRKHGLMFVNRNGRPYNAATLGTLMRKLVRRAEIYKRDHEGRVIINPIDGLPEARVTLYSFRHLVATFNADILPLRIAAGATGHTEEVMTRHYLHGRKSDKALVAGAAGKLEAELAKMLPAPTAIKMR